MPVDIEFLAPSSSELSTLANPANPAPNLLLLGRRDRLTSPVIMAALPESLRTLWTAVIEGLAPGEGGDSTTLWAPMETGAPQRVVALMLPGSGSRHNCPARPHAIASMVGRHAGRRGDLMIVLALEHGDHAIPAACAVARAFPLYSRKTGADTGATRSATVLLLPAEGAIDLERVRQATTSVRLAARLTDTPAEELNTDDFVAVARSLGSELGVSVRVLQGEELLHDGLGGLYNVGRAATHAPALVVLSHTPAEIDQPTLAWVGKGIVYDTGGLSMKGKTDMPGMKSDMGGAAAVLGAFAAAVRLGYRGKLHALLCLAENSVGPLAIRPDDILTMYSGKTVEINNTDAEGRLVLADGVAYAARNLQPAVIADLATLTGAQLVATGKRHAAVVCNEDALEARAVAAGRISGDLCHALPYCPEFYRGEFKSHVADMKNSVKDRNNAQTSCAAQFIAEHLSGYNGAWLHVDLAGPAVSEERATGFGVALLLELFCKEPGDNPRGAGAP